MVSLTKTYRKLMMRVNQKGEQIVETYLSEYDALSHAELQEIVFKLLDQLSLCAFKTNATKSGLFEINLEFKEQ